VCFVVGQVIILLFSLFLFPFVGTFALFIPLPAALIFRSEHLIRHQWATKWSWAVALVIKPQTGAHLKGGRGPLRKTKAEPVECTYFLASGDWQSGYPIKRKRDVHWHYQRLRGWVRVLRLLASANPAGTRRRRFYQVIPGGRSTRNCSIIDFYALNAAYFAANSIHCHSVKHLDVAQYWFLFLKCTQVVGGDSSCTGNTSENRTVPDEKTR